MQQIVIPVLNDVWMDNGIETLYQILKEAENESFEVKADKNSLIITVSDFTKFCASLGVAVKNRRSNLIVVGKDKKLGEMKEIKKDYILIQEGTKVAGKVSFKEELYNEDKTVEAVKGIFDLIVKEGTRTCIVCGRQYSKSVKKLQQAPYPFVTKIKSLSGVRSYKNDEVCSLKEYFDEFCPTCYFTGIIQWLDDGIIYRTIPGEKSILFLPQFNELDTLMAFKNSYRPNLNKNSRYCNVLASSGSKETENTHGAFSTLLCFYENLFFDADKKEIVGKKWAMVEIPFGSVKNLKYSNINIEDSVLQVIKDISVERIRLYKEIISKVSFFYDKPKGSRVNWDLTGEIRENLAWAVLKNDFHFFTSNFLPKKGGKVNYSKETREHLEELIYIWRLKSMGVKREELDTIKSVGNIIAKVSKKNKSVLFKLDKARTLADFWNVLREISRKLLGFDDNDTKMIKPMALDGIIQLTKEHESEWKEIRDLLVVYSSMYYSIGMKKESETND